MKMLNKITFAALVGAGALAIAAPASARIICNEEGDCWHAPVEYQYAPAFGLTIHPDDWHWKEGERHVWREHEGRGYWQHGEWRQF